MFGNDNLMIKKEYAVNTADQMQIGTLSTVLILLAAFVTVVLFGWASFPTLEGWGLLNVWRSQGVYAYPHYLGMFPDRPLHVLPSLFAGIVPGQFGVGAILVGALLAFTRIAAMLLLARALRVSGITAALLVIVGVSQPWWPGSAYERYHAAQVAYSLLLVGLLLGSGQSNKLMGWRNLSIAIVIFLGFLTYQGLFVVCAGAPLLFLLFGDQRTFRNLAGSFWPACVIYLVYFSVINALCSDNYVQAISKDNFQLEVFVKLFKVGLKSKLNAHLATVALTVVLLAATGSKLGNRGAAFLLALAIAPLTGIIFYRSDSIIRDPEHVMYAGTAWLTCLMTASARYLDSAVIPAVPLLARVVTLILLACGVVHPLKAIGHINTQLNVLSALDNSGIDWTEESNVLVIDQTGKLGRTYTFLEPHLQFARMAYHKPGFAILRSLQVSGPSCAPESNKDHFTNVLTIEEIEGTWLAPSFIARPMPSAIVGQTTQALQLVNSLPIND